MSKVLEAYDLWLEDMKIRRPSHYKRMRHVLSEIDHRFWFKDL